MSNKLPSNYADIRRLYTDGHYSVTNHIPIPNVVMITDHSFVSLTDCIADFLMRNNMALAPLNFSKNEFHQMNIFTCKRSAAIIGNGKQRMKDNDLEDTLPIVPVFIKFWSDDFDPNKSTKSNRQSVWIKTCTIFAVDIFGNKIQRTYPLSLSKKGCDHEVVEEHYNKELHDLKLGKLPIMYSRAHSSLAYVHAELFCVMNDQPERRSNLKLANGNSTVHGRFGYILDFKQVKDKIRSCTICTNDILLEIKELHYTNVTDPVSIHSYQIKLFW